MYKFKNWDSASNKLTLYSPSLEELYVYVEDNTLYTWNNKEILFQGEDALNKITGLREANICSYCKGMKYYEEEVRVECYVPASDCCGGCYKNEWVECECPNLIIKL